jgi:hypothetical protein
MCADGTSYPEQPTAPGTVCLDEGYGGFLVHSNDERCEPTPGACRPHETSVHCVKDRHYAQWYDSDVCSSQYFTCKDGAFCPTRHTDKGVLCLIGTGQLVCSTDDRCQKHDQVCVSAEVQAKGLPSFSSSTAGGTVPIRDALAGILSAALDHTFTVDDIAASLITSSGIAGTGAAGSGTGRRLKNSGANRKLSSGDAAVANGVVAASHISPAKFSARYGRSLQTTGYNVYAGPVSTVAGGVFSAGSDGWSPATPPLADVPIIDLTVAAGSAGIGTSKLEIKVYLPADAAASGAGRRLSADDAVAAVNAALTPDAETGLSPLTSALSDAGLPYTVATVTAPKLATSGSGAPTTTTGGSGGVTGASTGSDSSSAASSSSAMLPLIIGAAVGGLALAVAAIAVTMFVRRRRAVLAARAANSPSVPATASAASARPAMLSPTATQIPVRGQAAVIAAQAQQPRRKQPAAPRAQPTAPAVDIDDVALEPVTRVQGDHTRKQKSAQRKESRAERANTARGGVSRPASTDPSHRTRDAPALPAAAEDVSEDEDEVVHAQVLAQAQAKARKAAAAKAAAGKPNSASKKTVAAEVYDLESGDDGDAVTHSAPAHRAGRSAVVVDGGVVMGGRSSGHKSSAAPSKRR